MNVLISFFVSVMAGIVCLYVSKWLDSDNNDNYPKENPGDATPGFSLCAHMNNDFVFPTGIITYAIG